MKSAARLFYLSLFALWAPQVQCQQTADDASGGACAISPKAIVGDACASYSTLEGLNRKVKPTLDEVVHRTDFFSYYRLNLFHKTCPFWNDENGMCGNIACAVETLDNEEDIPPVWRASELGKLEGPRAKHPGKSIQRAEPQKPLRGGLGEGVGESCVVEYDDECDDRDYCVPDDESSASKGDYVSLLRNPERFTGYAGDGARQVWDAIYRENCFQKSSFPHSASLGKSAKPKGPAALDFKAVIDAAGRQSLLEQERQHNPFTPFVAKTGLEFEDECLEKRVFYRVVSGMHASISTHLCWDFLNQTTGQWQPNVGCYIARLHKFPDRISNLYFNYALLTRAIAKLGPFLSENGYTFCMGDPDQDAATRAKVLAVTENAASVPQTLDESLMFKNGEGPSLKEDFRNRFRNVSRLMDCVGCDKCRLWGKLQTAGYGAALKILFEFDNNNKPVAPPLKRTELVALFNTYARLSSSLTAVQQFRAMVEKNEAPPTEEVDEAETPSAEKIEKVEKIEETTWNVIPDPARKPHHVIVSKPAANSPSTAASQKSVTRPSEAADDEIRDHERPEYHEKTFREVLDDEIGELASILREVVNSWAKTPGILWHIVTSELRRFWQFYIGLPVSPRSWAFKRPDMDEL